MVQIDLGQCESGLNNFPSLSATCLLCHSQVRQRISISRPKVGMASQSQSLLVWYPLHLMETILIMVSFLSSQELVDQLYSFRECYFETHSVEHAGRKQQDVREEMEKTLQQMEEVVGMSPKRTHNPLFLKCDGALLSLQTLWYSVCGCYKLVQQNVSSQGACAGWQPFRSPNSISKCCEMKKSILIA